MYPHSHPKAWRAWARFCEVRGLKPDSYSLARDAFWAGYQGGKGPTDG